ncbi:MAG TPA: DUF1801 domain-containing protein [Candidatus Saccharimonadales bacterium]|nr:DUF1801 domain-containing protein [Candidatus Saccharimonadales bacterium]
MNKNQTVEAFLDGLTNDRKAQVNKLRQIIKQVAPGLEEHIKWNSPSYVLDGEDRVTFNMHYPDKTMILLHMGATKKENKDASPVFNDKTGLVKWNSDIRGTLSFSSLEEIERHEQQIAEILSGWLSLSPDAV